MRIQLAQLLLPTANSGFPGQSDSIETPLLSVADFLLLFAGLLLLLRSSAFVIGVAFWQTIV